jgi:hypothetical protein
MLTRSPPHITPESRHCDRVNIGKKIPLDVTRLVEKRELEHILTTRAQRRLATRQCEGIQRGFAAALHPTEQHAIERVEQVVSGVVPCEY